MTTLSDYTTSDYNGKKRITNEFNEIDSIEEPWTLIESYFDNCHLERLVRHQQESYNNFVEYQLEKTIEMFNPIKITTEDDFIKEHNLHRLEVLITFTNFSIFRPQIHENNGAIKLMFPQEARLRNFTYASSMTVDINIQYIVRSGANFTNIHTYNKILPKIHIGKLPIMTKSKICVLSQYKHFNSKETGECKHDTGGYFIINGSEKVVLGQERACENRVQCFYLSKNNTKYSWMAEIKSIPDDKCISPKQINIMVSSKNNGFGYPLVIQIPRIKQPIPLFVAFRALGVISDKDICEKILLDIYKTDNAQLLNFLQASIIEANSYLTYEDCIKYVTSHVMFTPINMDKETGARKKQEFAIDIIQNDLYPHCKNIQQKIYFLGYMSYQLLSCVFKIKKQDDRDSYLNKRIDTTGILLNNLFRNYFNKVVKDMEKQVIKELKNGSWKSTEDYLNIINLTNIYKIIKSNTIENGLKRALGTGDFGIKNTNSNKVGVAQVLNRLTSASSLSHVRRISTPIDKSGKLVPPRKLHNTTWGFICPSETPEGQSVGVVKSLSYMTHITITSISHPLYDYVLPYIQIIDEQNPITNFNSEHIKVFINGGWIGITTDPFNLYNDLKDKKYKGIINIYTSIIFDYRLNEIRICNDAGRLTRPLLKVKNKTTLLTETILADLEQKKITWNDLLISTNEHDSIIEYLDPEEQAWSMIALTPSEVHDPINKLIKYTHCEIHPSSIFGILGSCIPFPENNQSPRNTYQCAQAKQAMGVYVTNYQNRMDKTAYVLNYPMRPFVDTRLMNILKLNEIPSGTNVIVAIMTHTGYNQEDSLLINKGSIDRGMSLVTVYHTEKDEDKQKINGDEEIRCKPDPQKTKGMKIANYNKINSKGVIDENTKIDNRDIIISKIVPIKENKNDHTKIIKFEDQSRLYKTTEDTYIDKNYIDRNGDGYNFAKVRLRTLRKPVIGDKFCIKETSLILTNLGWIPFKDIDIHNHLVATLINGKELKYVQPSAKHIFDCIEEDLYSMESQQVKMICTMNHKVYVRKRDKENFEFLEANKVMGKRVSYKKDALNTNEDVQYISCGEGQQYLTTPFLKILGVFISDGYYDKGEKHTRICFAMKKPRKVQFLTEALAELNIHYNYSHNRVIVGNTYKDFVTFFQALSLGAPNKRLPDFVWELSQNQCRILLEALIQGDGSITNTGTSLYHTSSVLLAEDIQRLCLHAGWAANLKVYKGREAGCTSIFNDRVIQSNYDSITVSIVKKKNTPQVNHGHVHTQNKQKETIIQYTGKVGCIEVPETHLFYYKDDLYSPPIWTGNSSRHGQKGTIGSIIPEADIPFTQNGIKPDIIINPHAIPSRMTIGQLKETLLGKVLVELGLFGDGTSFGNFDITDICAELLKLGYETSGEELLYDGITGEQHECSVFMGPVFYQRLKHMVKDKTHSRSIGPMVNLTRQPAEGRSRDGGLRFGEMERDCMISHGASRFTKDRMYDVSDKYSVYSCKNCGLIANYNDKMKIHNCKSCDNRINFSHLEIPYSCKLLFQELNTMNVVPRFITQH